jgi:hypothetical protein
MGSGRSVKLALIAGFVLAFSTAGVRHVKQQTDRHLTHIPRDVTKPTCSPAIPRPSSVTVYSPWRNRIKSVLEETSPRIIVESDLGPVPGLSQVIPFVLRAISPSRQLTTLPLRC